MGLLCEWVWTFVVPQQTTDKQHKFFLFSARERLISWLCSSLGANKKAAMHCDTGSKQ